MDELVSILIPVYNRKNFIAECIESALNQSYENIEVIISDNCSTDGTWEICKEYQKKDSRIRIFRNHRNVGPVLNWINCAEKARGSYSKILFSDDLLKKVCVEKMVVPLARKEIGFTFCSAELGVDIDNYVVNYHLNGDGEMVSGDYIKLVLNGDAPVSPGAVMIRTKDLKKNIVLNINTLEKSNYSENGAGPDLMIMLKTALDYTHVYYIMESLVFFRIHDSSITIGDQRTQVQKNYILVIAYYLKNYSGRFIWSDYVLNRWVGRIRRERIFISIFKHARALEAQSLVDFISIILIVPYSLWKIFQKKRNFFYKKNR